MPDRRPIFFISDGTGITAETIGNSVLTQFDGVNFIARRLPFIDNEEKVRAAIVEIEAAQQSTGSRAIVVNTVIDPELTALLSESGVVMLYFL